MTDSSRRAPERDVDPESAARTIALRLLEHQPRTRVELERALARRGVPADAAAAVLDRLGEVGLVDDAAFARAWVDSRHAGRGLGRRALAAELHRRGVDPQLVGDAVGAVSGDDERLAAAALVRRRLPSLASHPVEVQLRRLVAMLARRGFGAGLATAVVREQLEMLADHDGGA